MSDRRQLLKGLTSLPLATVLASPRLAVAVSAGLVEVEATLREGTPVKAALAGPRDQAKGSILLIHEWWGPFISIDARERCGFPIGWWTLVRDNPSGGTTLVRVDHENLSCTTSDSNA